MFLPLKKALEQDVSSVGAKAKLFAKLEEQVRLPFSLVISSEVFSAFLNHNNVEEKIAHLFENANTPEKVVEGFTRLAQIFEQATFPPEVVAELRECFELAALDTGNLESLSPAQQGGAILVLRRSTDYKDTDSTCPGTIFTKESFTDFLRAVKSCLLSAFTPSSINARRAEQISSFTVAIIVSRLPQLQTCFESSLSFHKNNILVQSYMGFPDRSNIVPKDSFMLSVDFLRIIDAKVVEQTIVAVFDKVTNQLQHKKYNHGGSAQTVPDQTILEVGRLTKKINTIMQSQGITAQFIADKDGVITCLDVMPASQGKEEQVQENKQIKESTVDTTQEKASFPKLAEGLAGEEELAAALIAFLTKHKFSKFGPTINVVVRSLENEVNAETLKQGIFIAKELLDETD